MTGVEGQGQAEGQAGRPPGAGGRVGLGVVVTDLDGTLLDSNHRLPLDHRRALEALGARGVLRVVATGRSPLSLRRVLMLDAPVDYVAFSSGAGIQRWPSGELLAARHLPAGAARRLARGLPELGMDFMLHGRIPDNHHFVFGRSRANNPDFDRRLALYEAYGEPLELARLDGERCQAMVIEPRPDAARERRLREAFPDLSIIVATSPLDGQSRWLEIFAGGVSKSSAASWLVERQRPSRATVMAIGNDYNDRDLLEWADLSFVVANAPGPLRARHRTVASNDEGGFAEAVRHALERFDER